MSIHLERKDLTNAQQMEVAVNGPDGATHLILCTGVVDMGHVSHETYTFLVGPQISRRQFVGAIASGALATIQTYDKHIIKNSADVEVGANLVLIDANYDDESGKVIELIRTLTRQDFPETNLEITDDGEILKR